MTTGSGDGTVLLISAAIEDPRVRNLPPVQVVHDALPDKAVAQVLTELNVPVPAVGQAATSQPRLVILTASPLELTVEAPAAAPAVLSEAGPASSQRRRSVKGKNYGHRGKRLNMAIIPAPADGTYNVRLRGTATGTFALGVLLVGAGDQAASIAPVTLGEAGEGIPAKTELTSPIDTVRGQVAAETELRYQVVLAPDAAPRVRFDAEATTRDALARLSAAAAAPGPLVLGDESAPPRVPAVLSATDAPDEVRALVSAALVEGDASATRRLAELLGAADGATFELLRQVAEQVVAPRNRALALGLLEQLRQVAVLGAGA
jgi:hypothetical protein